MTSTASDTALLWRVGVDGGATRSRARVRNARGRTLGEASGPAANIHVDFAAAIGALGALVGEVLAKAKLSDADRARIGIGFGIAGLNDAGDAAGIAAGDAA